MKLHRLLYLVSSWTLLLSLPIPFAQAGGGGAGPGGSTGSLTGTTSPGGSQSDVRGAGTTGTGHTHTDPAKGQTTHDKTAAQKSKDAKQGATVAKPAEAGKVKGKAEEKKDSFYISTLQMITTICLLASVV
ncbi:hypothetical protein BgAZ_207300 [Babesia gibsoni]|uniref:12 kDa protein n=1 Tax=Babesia gibsoni TaxID=33632 RepID=A0AAD8PEJ0_BABGI|nr:hypothetical protein BgAZ_207300 [Babesia gibsoni]